MTSASKLHESANESSGSEQRKTNKQTIKQLASIVKSPSQTSEHAQEVDIAIYNELIDAANQPPMKNLICYSVNQIDVLQQSGNHTFVSQFESDEFMQKFIGLLKSQKQLKPAASLHRGAKSTDAQFRLERFCIYGLVISKALQPIFINRFTTATMLAAAPQGGGYNCQRMLAMQRVR